MVSMASILISWGILIMVAIGLYPATFLLDGYVDFRKQSMEPNWSGLRIFFIDLFLLNESKFNKHQTGYD